MQISDFCKEHNVAYLDILVEELLIIENQGVLINRVAEITDERVLYLLGYSYNWDNGFAVPKAIIKNPNCHLSTALALFYLADGTRYLKDKSDVEKNGLTSWKNFIVELYEKIVGGYFEKSNIGFIPPLSKVEQYKLKKLLDLSEYVFIEKIDGENL